jgi:hypothetical protein
MRRGPAARHRVASVRAIPGACAPVAPLGRGQGRATAPPADGRRRAQRGDGVLRGADGSGSCGRGCRVAGRGRAVGPRRMFLGRPARCLRARPRVTASAHRGARSPGRRRPRLGRGPGRRPPPTVGGGTVALEARGSRPPARASRQGGGHPSPLGHSPERVSTAGVDGRAHQLAHDRPVGPRTIRDDMRGRNAAGAPVGRVRWSQPASPPSAARREVDLGPRATRRRAADGGRLPAAISHTRDRRASSWASPSPDGPQGAARGGRATLARRRGSTLTPDRSRLERSA